MCSGRNYSMNRIHRFYSMNRSGFCVLLENGSRPWKQQDFRKEKRKGTGPKFTNGLEIIWEFSHFA